MIIAIVQQSPLQNMFSLKTASTRASADPGSLRSAEFAQSFMQVSFLQNCIAACEVLADELDADVQRDALQQQLSECVSICELYLGANVRESRYRVRYGIMCAEVCAETARACRKIQSAASRECQVLCFACVKLIENDFQTVLSN